MTFKLYNNKGMQDLYPCLWFGFLRPIKDFSTQRFKGQLWGPSARWVIIRGSRGELCLELWCHVISGKKIKLDWDVDVGVYELRVFARLIRDCSCAAAGAAFSLIVFGIMLDGVRSLQVLIYSLFNQVPSLKSKFIIHENCDKEKSKTYVWITQVKP